MQTIRERGKGRERETDGERLRKCERRQRWRGNMRERECRGEGYKRETRERVKVPGRLFVFVVIGTIDCAVVMRDLCEKYGN